MAGGSSGGSGKRKKARLEIIPLIDIIFFLLADILLPLPYFVLPYLWLCAYYNR